MDLVRIVSTCLIIFEFFICYYYYYWIVWLKISTTIYTTRSICCKNIKKRYGITFFLSIYLWFVIKNFHVKTWIYWIICKDLQHWQEQNEKNPDKRKRISDLCLEKDRKRGMTHL